MLQGRTFSYVDTQRYRLGANFHELPTNKLLANVANNQRDGAMQCQVFKGTVSFEPSSQGSLRLLAKMERHISLISEGT